MSNQTIELRWLKADDADLAEIAAELNTDDWETGPSFSAETLQKFLARDDRLYLVAYLDGKLAGAIHAYIYPHPAGATNLYIDEVDTREGARQKGVATAMMNEVFRMAKERGIDEAWLGTEHDNEAALALYHSLKPDEEENGPTFSWKIK